MCDNVSQFIEFIGYDKIEINRKNDSYDVHRSIMNMLRKPGIDMQTLLRSLTLNCHKHSTLTCRLDMSRLDEVPPLYGCVLTIGNCNLLLQDRNNSHSGGNRKTKVCYNETII